ncbi:MAG TPA: hypothetical protein VMA75_02195 [Candidatus Paceibacterota bacterium]|nr:hypothetical protein [Candidatus Paceibacterota bacterium]
MWKQWVNVLLGLLVIVLAYSSGGTMWSAIAGLVVAILALWSALEKKKM